MPDRVRFSWWVQDLVPGASVADSAREDAAARVIFGFAGDVSSLPVGTVVVNPRSDRVRKIVVDSGASLLRQWRDHERDLAADFRLAFGEEPGLITSVGVMTDSDNTRSRGRSWFGEVHWR